MPKITDILFLLLGIDSNMCCGTHVKNLSDIQVSETLFQVFTYHHGGYT